MCDVLTDILQLYTSHPVNDSSPCIRAPISWHVLTVVAKTRTLLSASDTINAIATALSTASSSDVTIWKLNPNPSRKQDFLNTTARFNDKRLMMSGTSSGRSVADRPMKR